MKKAAAILLATCLVIMNLLPVTKVAAEPEILGFTIDPASQTIPQGTHLQFSAIITTTEGDQDVTNKCTWSSSNPGIASVPDIGWDSQGCALSYTAGTVTIEASYLGHKASALLTVEAPVLQDIEVTPLNSFLFPGEQVQLRALGTYADGTIKDITAAIVWEHIHPSIVTVSETGLVTAVAGGTSAIVYAFLDGIKGVTNFNVKDSSVTLQGIEILPDNSGNPAGLHQQLTALAHCDDGSSFDVTDRAAWSSNDTIVAIPKPGGMVKTYTAGTAEISASFSGFTDQTTLNVTPPELACIDVTPHDPEIDLVSGTTQTIRFKATAVYTNGHTSDCTDLVWWSSSTPAAFSNGNGLFTLIDSGVATIYADYEWFSGSSNLIVHPDTTPPELHLTNPSEGQVFSDPTITISGVTEPSAEVEIFIHGILADRLTASESGEFSTDIMLSEGINMIEIQTADPAGNTGTSGTITVCIDPAAPDMMIDTPCDGMETNLATTTVTGTILNDQSTRLYINGSIAATLLNGPFSVPVTLKEGTNTVVVSGYNSGGILGSSGVRTIIRDTAGPDVTLITPSPGMILASRESVVYGKVDDPSVTSGTLTVNGIPVTVPVGNGSFIQKISLNQGSNMIGFCCSDALGNQSCTGYTNVTYDTTKPEVIITAPENMLSTNEGAILVSGTIDDPSITQALLKVNGTPRTIAVTPDGSFTAIIALNEGYNCIEVEATDMAMNTGSSGLHYVFLDQTPPEITISMTDPTSMMNFTITGSEELAYKPNLTGVLSSLPLSRTRANEWTGTLGSVPSGPQLTSVLARGKAPHFGKTTAAFIKTSIDVIPGMLAAVETDTVYLEYSTTDTLTGKNISITHYSHNPYENDIVSDGSAGIFFDIIGDHYVTNCLDELYIEVNYDKIDIYNLGLDEATLKLYTWDTRLGKWIAEPNSGANTTGKYIWGYVHHMSRFGIFGSALTPEPIIPPPPIPPTQVDWLQTEKATNVSKTSAMLNGELLDMSGYDSVNVSFDFWQEVEPGTVSGVQPTVPEEMTSPGTFNNLMTGLEEGATYSYVARADAVNSTGGLVQFTGITGNFTTLTIDDYENFLTDYTELDPEGTVSVLSQEIDFANTNFRGSDTYVYCDKGENFFDGDFEHSFETMLTARDSYAITSVWTLSTHLEDREGIRDAGGNYLSFFFYQNQLRIQERTNGAEYEDTWYEGSLDTPYYLVIKRDESIGPWGRIYGFIYGDAERTNLLHTLELDLHGKIDFRYIFGLITNNDGQAYRASGYVRDMYLQQPATEILCGDADGNGIINIMDITRVARIILGLDQETPGADADENGTVNVFDIAKIVRILLGLDTP